MHCLKCCSFTCNKRTWQSLRKIPFQVSVQAQNSKSGDLKVGEQESMLSPQPQVQMLCHNTGTVKIGCGVKTRISALSNYSEILGPASLSSVVLGCRRFWQEVNGHMT